MPTAPAPRDGPRIELPMRLTPSRGKAVALLALSVGFLALGLWLAQKQPWFGYLAAGFFALGIPVFAARLLPGAFYLELTAEGFTFSALLRKKTERWQDIAGFGVWRAGPSRKVGWLYAAGRRVSGQTLSEAMSGVHGSLPDTYGMNAEKLAALMNELKRRSAPPPG